MRSLAPSLLIACVAAACSPGVESTTPDAPAEDGAPNDVLASDGSSTFDVSREDARGSICGNAELGGGEECDDGNREPDDGCSPECTLDCGDARVSGRERCDVAILGGAPGACPVSCDDSDPCTTDSVTGMACDARCEHLPIVAPISGDRCCPAGVGVAMDSDCPARCGDGLRTGDEACDIGIPTGAPGACPATCDDGVACTTDRLEGAATCDARCVHTTIGTPVDGDGCCAPGSDLRTDRDCPVACGDTVLSLGEACDTAILSGVGRCPTTCDDGVACTMDTLADAGTCAARCVVTPITVAAAGDGCCPSGATAATDADCPAGCGDGIVQAGETCDTAIGAGSGRCPTVCNDSQACTSDVLVGAGTCVATCVFAPITMPRSGDGCCPSGATIATDADCPASCGDGVVSVGEACDDRGPVLSGATCASRGYTAGTLGCRGCVFNEDACTLCGDGTREGTEVCDGADVGGATCATLGFRSGTVRCGSSCASLDTSLCSLGAAPAPGQLVITEIMPDPVTIADADGEWFEVTNTATVPLELRGCVFSDTQAMPTSFTVTSSLVVPPGGYATFARSSRAGFAASFVYSGWALSNGNDEVILTCGGLRIDAVAYTTEAAWRFGPGRSTSLSPRTTSAAANDVAMNWCPGATVYETSGPNRGTPGAANPACEICGNGTDDDASGASDCADPSCATSVACVDARPGLRFGEYVEGSADNKALEVWNATGSTRSLVGCGVRLYANSSSAPTATLPLTGSLAGGDVVVLCNRLAMAIPTAACDLVSDVTNFNGDDVVELFCGDTVMDVIGQIGVPPAGSGWTASGVSTANQTLRPVCGSAPDTVATDAFNPSVRWRGFPVDTFTGLGAGACAP